MGRATKDIFCNQGKAWMKRAALPSADRKLLDDDLALHAELQSQIDSLEQMIVAESALSPLASRLQTLPGVGKILAPVIALEIDMIATRSGFDPRSSRMNTGLPLVPLRASSQRLGETERVDE